MNWITELPLFLQLAQFAVLAIQGIHGEAVKGTDKMTMAKDAFGTLVAGVIPKLPVEQQGIAGLTAVLGGVVLQSAYLLSKADGTYDAATTVAASSTATPTPTA